jgi:hypothetical protein
MHGDLISSTALVLGLFICLLHCSTLSSDLRWPILIVRLVLLPPLPPPPCTTLNQLAPGISLLFTVSCADVPASLPATATTTATAADDWRLATATVPRLGALALQL